MYIELYRDGPREHEPDEWADIISRFGGEPAVGVAADVSGRHPGDNQVADLVAGLLTRFRGPAMDDYTTHERFRMFSGNDARRTMRTDQTTPKTIDEYIAGFPHEVQEILEKIRKTIRTAAPDAEETIKYRMPTFTLKGNLVHFAAFRKHVGFYPVPTGIEGFRNELSVYEGGKGSVKFPLDKPIPLDLIGKIVEFRVKENLERAEAKGKKK